MIVFARLSEIDSNPQFKALTLVQCPKDTSTLVHMHLLRCTLPVLVEGRDIKEREYIQGSHGKQV